MTARYLLDASALYPLALSLRGKLLNYSDLMAVLDLTVYEVGNAVWKECKRGRIRDPRALAVAFAELFSNVETVKLESRAIAEVLELALAEEITFYDAAYLYAARKLGMKLVTEDSDLKKYPEAVSVSELVAELERSGLSG